MTAHALDEDRDACFAAGMDDYIPKPVTLEKLTEALSAVQLSVGAQSPGGIEVDVDETLPATGVAGSVVDVKKLAQLKRTVGGEQLASFLDEFIADSSGLLDRISEAAHAADAGAVQKAAHMLRSTSALVGALELTDVCVTLERSSKVGDTSRAKELAARAKELFSGVQADLGRLLQAV
jgi:CheY-like chemotaxis protein